MNKFGTFLLAAMALAGSSYAVETRFWQQTESADFEKGTIRNLSLRSDGRLYLAPDFREIYDPSVPYLWALASDGKGNLYAGGGGSGGSTTKLFAIDSSGKGKVLAELDGLEIHALAVGSDGQIYAATDPDGKVYKISPQGKSQLFFDPHSKYIWALAFNRQGDLFVATGDQGEIFRVGRDGKGSVFYKTNETHARSMVADDNGNLIVGTEPDGLVLRISASGQGYVLYQMSKREVTAVAVAKNGEIYAAAVGTRSSTPAVVSPAPAPASSTPAASGASGGASARPSTAPPSFATPSTSIPGGSEVYRIAADGSPRKVWGSSQDAVYAIGFDSSGLPLLGTGNRGKIFRIDSTLLNTVLIESPPTQITNFAQAGNRLFAVTGNIGRVYEIGPAAAKSGSYESEAFDGGAFTYWGRLSLRGSPKNVTIRTRSGNLSRPQDGWSPWAALDLEKDNATGACPRCLNGRVTSPPARFLQYKIDVVASSSVPVPEIASVEVAYLTKNVAPVIDEIELTPANYKFPAPPPPPTTTNSPQSLSLSPLGQKKHNSTTPLDLTTSQSLTYAKGMLGARWTASDDNGDSLLYTVEIRGVGEPTWKLIRDKVREKYITWDSSAFPDGEYELRLTASDSPSNSPGETLTASLTSDPFLIDNTPPRILNLSAASSAGKLQVRWSARDGFSNIDKAEYSLNGGDWVIVVPKARLTDSPEAEYALTIDRSGSGAQVIAVRVTDSYDNQSLEKIVVK